MRFLAALPDPPARPGQLTCEHLLAFQEQRAKSAPRAGWQDLAEARLLFTRPALREQVSAEVLGHLQRRLPAPRQHPPARRTLAWFIARRPGGVIAGALAYRHHCVQVFEGYAGTSESGFRAEVESEQALARGEYLLAAIDAHEHTSLTGPAAEEAARRLETFGERVRFQGTIITDQARLRRLMARHDPAVYPGEYVTCVHDHTKALCEKARHGRGEGLPDHGECKPLACRNVALTTENIAAWQREIDRIGTRLAARPPLPPLLQHRLETRHAEVTAFLARNTIGRAPA